MSESIANELKSVDITKVEQERIVENFMANQDQLDNLLNLLDLDEVAETNNQEIETNNQEILDNKIEYQAPPSNSSSTCTRLAIGKCKDTLIRK